MVRQVDNDLLFAKEDMSQEAWYLLAPYRGCPRGHMGMRGWSGEHTEEERRLDLCSFIKYLRNTRTIKGADENFALFDSGAIDEILLYLNDEETINKFTL